jgi:hypothetical protein
MNRLDGMLGAKFKNAIELLFTNLNHKFQIGLVGVKRLDSFDPSQLLSIPLIQHHFKYLTKLY